MKRIEKLALSFLTAASFGLGACTTRPQETVGASCTIASSAIVEGSVKLEDFTQYPLMHKMLSEQILIMQGSLPDSFFEDAKRAADIITACTTGSDADKETVRAVAAMLLGDAPPIPEALERYETTYNPDVARIANMIVAGDDDILFEDPVYTQAQAALMFAATQDLLAILKEPKMEKLPAELALPIVAVALLSYEEQITLLTPTLETAAPELLSLLKAQHQSLIQAAKSLAAPPVKLPPIYRAA